jgi:hypothetical protein
MMMLGSFENAMLVFKDVRLVWQARTMTAPIFVDVSTFENKQGLIVTLADNGFLQVSFLGTEQLTTNAQALALKNQRKIDYEQVNAEHARIVKQIRAHEENRQAEPTDSIQVSCQLLSKLEVS